MNPIPRAWPFYLLVGVFACFLTVYVASAQMSGRVVGTLNIYVTSSFAVTYGTVFKYNSHYPTKYVLGDSFATTWSNDDVIYSISDDTHGFDNSSDSNISIATLSTPDISMTGTTINPMLPFGPTEATGSDGATYKANGIISVANKLYVSVSRQGWNNNLPGVPSGVTTEGNGQIIRSDDHDINWAPFPTATGQPYSSTMFSGNTFAAPNFIQYGKDYAGNTVDNSNLYVYATANEGCWNNCSKLFLGRVLITDLPSLTGSTWQFYQGSDGMISANWSTSWSTAQPLISSPYHVGNISQVQYIPGFGFAGGTFIWIGWYYPSVPPSIDSATTVWTFYVAPHPWGPYQLANTKTWNSSPGKGLYSPNIITKSISVVGGKTATMNIATAGDFNTWNNPSTGDYTLTLVPLTVTTP
jgi:hypothetical protein